MNATLRLCSCSSIGMLEQLDFLYNKNSDLLLDINIFQKFVVQCIRTFFLDKDGDAKVEHQSLQINQRTSESFFNMFRSHSTQVKMHFQNSY